MAHALAGPLSPLSLIVVTAVLARPGSPAPAAWPRKRWAAGAASKAPLSSLGDAWVKGHRVPGGGTMPSTYGPLITARPIASRAAAAHSGVRRDPVYGAVTPPPASPFWCVGTEEPNVPRVCQGRLSASCMAGINAAHQFPKQPCGFWVPARGRSTAALHLHLKTVRASSLNHIPDIGEHIEPQTDPKPTGIGESVSPQPHPKPVGTTESIAPQPHPKHW